MRQSVTSFRVTQTLLLATAAVLAGFVACEVRSPTEPVSPQVELTKGPIAMPADQPYFEFQVENPVTPAPGGGQPRYPDALRLAGVNGEVLAQFIVGPDGRADVESFKVLKSSNDLFTQSVRNALSQMRFKPALVGGKAVRQLVQQPFTFTISQ
jgi:protein TonB